MSIRVHGRVQGVYFRKSCQEEARRLGLTGWTANQPDGSVLIEAEGTDEALSRFLDWCHEGPPMARVQQVEVTESPISPQERSFSDFQIRY